MLREDPGLDTTQLAMCLATHYDVRVAAISYLPLGYDLNAFVYDVRAGDGSRFFLKARRNPLEDHALHVPRALLEHGISPVVAPLPANDGDLTVRCGALHLILYPFVPGANAMDSGLTTAQWREYGAAMRAMHDSGLAERFRSQLRMDHFDLPSAALVRSISALLPDAAYTSPAATAFATFWRAQQERIDALLRRAEALGAELQEEHFPRVLCHGDIHAANILAGDDGQVYLVDWDYPLIAPRERDLLFVVGSHIARSVLPQEEDAFFSGYGACRVNPLALAHYRYERIIEDIGETGQSVFLDAHLSEGERREGAALAMSFFAPGADIDRAEIVTRTSWPDPDA